MDRVFAPRPKAMNSKSWPHLTSKKMEFPRVHDKTANPLDLLYLSPWRTMDVRSDFLSFFFSVRDSYTLADIPHPSHTFPYIPPPPLSPITR